MPRLFTCVWIPDTVKDKITDFQDKMKVVSMGVKFIEPENLHITITFLCEKDENEIRDISERLDKVTKNSRKFHVKLEGLRIIPSENYIRVIGVKLNPEHDFQALVRNISAVLGGDSHHDNKMTLCRVRNINNRSEILNFIKKNASVTFGEVKVESVSLVKSVLTDKGPIYETIHKSFLG